jgi:hypothetical protein
MWHFLKVAHGRARRRTLLEIRNVSRTAAGLKTSTLPDDWGGTEQLELPLRSSYAGRSDAVLWVLAATEDDSQDIVEAIRHYDTDNLSSFFVSVQDGAPAFGSNDILAIRRGHELLLFASRLPAIPTRCEVAAQIANALSNPLEVQARSQEAAEFLFVRLFASAKEERQEHADSALGRSLSFLQSFGAREAAPWLACEMAGEILEAMPEAGSLALDGLVRRLKAHALFEAGQLVSEERLGHLDTACSLYFQAARSFQRAGIVAQAQACLRYGRMLEQLILCAKSPEPTLPGLEWSVADARRMHLKRPGFRSFRALAVPLSIRVPLELRADGPATAPKLHQIGAITLPKSALIHAMREVESTNLVPRLTVTDSAEAPLTKRVRVSIDREHFALLGLEDKGVAVSSRCFGVILSGSDWEMSLERGTAAHGRPVEFDVRARSRDASPLSVLVTAGADLGKFQVSATSHQR